MSDIQQKLDKELKHVTFSSEREVLAKVQEKSLLKRVSDYLNKEIEIPVIMLSGATILILFFSSVFPLIMHDKQQGEPPKSDSIVVKGNNHYLESFWEDEVKKDEN